MPLIKLKKPIIAIAPMVRYTDRHFRYFMRLLSRHVRLYTEMVTTASLLHAPHPERYVQYDPIEHPLALQLGGSDPEELALCIQSLSDGGGYSEINLNVGCPSSRVQAGRFGACLMAEPELVAQCVKAMVAVSPVPVTVKTRLGLGKTIDYPILKAFIAGIVEAGAAAVILHARLADLQKTTRQNRSDTLPLHYDIVYRVKSDFPEVPIVLNGGVNSIAAIQTHLQHVDGVMIGRAAISQPYFLSEIDKTFFGDDHPIPTREEIVERYLTYVEEQVQKGERRAWLVRHLFGLYHGMPHAKEMRRSWM